MLIQLKNGCILTEPGQLDPVLAMQPVKTVAWNSEVVESIISQAAAVRLEWLAEGAPLDSVQISVQDMLDEIANILDRAGCHYNRARIIGPQ